ncbi:transposase family protein [Streptomyces sp. NBC_00029]|uniref:helix-turn-helix domain-containing protein n=1 Tax=Streptomyces sp. NBC_00029 TaxID=2903613 RepID=UPI00324C8BB0
MVGTEARAAIIGDRRITGLSADVIAELVAELGPSWHDRHQARLVARPRKRAVGAGSKHQLVFIDRLLATLVHLRHGATHDVLACWFGVDRSTVTRAIGEVRPLLAERDCTISQGLSLRTLAEVIDHLGSSGQTGIIDGTEIRVRRPAAGMREVPAAEVARPTKAAALEDLRGAVAPGGALGEGAVLNGYQSVETGRGRVVPGQTEGMADVFSRQVSGTLTRLFASWQVSRSAGRCGPQRASLVPESRAPAPDDTRSLS